MKWRSVNKELPPDLQNVLLSWDFGADEPVLIVGHRFNNGWYDDQQLIAYDNGFQKVTHWMPLPAYPKYQNTMRKKR